MSKATEQIIPQAALKGKSYEIMRRDNRSIRKRDPDEGLLFVPAAPHEVRPPEHTGIEYQIDESGLDVTLNDPSSEPTYDLTSLLVKSPHKLCTPCLDVLNYMCEFNKSKDKRNVEPIATTSDQDDDAARQVKRRLQESQTKETHMPNSVVHHFNL